ncbi:MAG: SCP2 sterol-binding domain-containing protein [Actinobacteria bacterium]|nr:SCP2 sterol-binding domain-containing protein [Actinomycetota bacterium]
MAAFLTDAWVADLANAARESSALRGAAGADTLVLQQVVRGAPGGTFAWHLVLGPGTAEVHEGRAARADVTLTSDAATAAAVAAGRASAQAAFMTGRLRVGGRITALLEHRAALAALDDVFGAVRARTTFPVDAGTGDGDAAAGKAAIGDSPSRSRSDREEAG